jgi:hypothetical protein
MTATRDPDRLLRAWLDLMPDEAPDRAIAAVLQATETARQVRALPRIGRWRLPMNRIAIIATAVLVIAALAGGAYLLAGGPSRPVLPTPTVAPTAAPTATAAAGVAPAAQLLWGLWLADVPAIPSFNQPAARLQLSIDWQNGTTVLIERSVFDDCCNGFKSETLEAGPKELGVRADLGALGCATGQEGRYTWDRSANGMFLTLTLVEDACANRAAAFARTWVHSLGAVNDGGRGVNIGLTPPYEITLPNVQLAQGGPNQAPVIHTCASSGCGSGGAFDPEPGFSFVTIRDPLGWVDPCESAGPQTAPIEQTTAAFVAYMKGLPGMSVTTQATQVDGRPAVRLDLTSDAGITCQRGEVHLFRSLDPPENNGGDYGLQLGDATTMWIVDLGTGDTVLFWYSGDGVTAADQQAAIDSIKFLDKLPTS